MPSPIASMLGLQSPSNVATTQSPYTPNIGRNPAKTAILSKMLGIPEADDGSISQVDLQGAYNDVSAAQTAAEREKAQLATLPAQVTGEYGLKEAEIKRQSGVDAAERAALERQTGREFNASQNELNRNAIAERQQASSSAVDARTQQTQQAIRQRQLELSRQPLRQKAPGPSLWESIFGKSTPTVAPEIQSLAEQIKAENPGASLDQLVQSGDLDPNDFTPEQFQQLQSVLGQP